MTAQEHPVEQLLGEIMRAANPHSPDRGMLACLRRGLGEATEPYAWPYLAPYCDLTDPREKAIWAFAAGAAATLCPDGLVRERIGNMGATMRKLAVGDNTKEADASLNSFKARFHRLLTCRIAEELCLHLVPVVRAAQAKGVPVDVRRLFWDLRKWETHNIRLEWAQGYWGVPKGED